MTNNDFQEKINSITKKLGEENSGLIADDLAILISDNADMNTQNQNNLDTIKNLKKEKDNLITVNRKFTSASFSGF